MSDVDTSRLTDDSRFTAFCAFFKADPDVVKTDYQWSVRFPGIRTQPSKHQIWAAWALLEMCHIQGGGFLTDVMGLGKVRPL